MIYIKPKSEDDVAAEIAPLADLDKPEGTPRELKKSNFAVLYSENVFLLFFQ
jgi:hypothetical protein